MSDWRYLRRLLRGSSVWTGTAYLLLALTWAAGIALLALSGWFITAAALAGAGLLVGLDVFTPAAGIRLVALLRTLARYGERVIGHEAVLRVLAKLRVRSFAAIARLPISAQQRFRSGDLQQRLTTDIDTLDAVPLRINGPVTAAVLAVTATTLLATWLAPWPAPLLILGTATLTLAASALAAWLGQSRGRETVAERSQQRVALLDFFGGLADLFAYRRMEAQRTLLDALEHAQATRLRAQERVAVVAEQSVQLLVGLTTLLMLVVTLQWYAAGEIGAPVAVLLTLMTFGLNEALGALPGAAWRIGESLQASARLRALGVESVGKPAADSAASPVAAIRVPLESSLEVHALEVGFYSDRPLLSKLSFALTPGQPLVIHGRSGLGKSTLLATLAGELAPLGGTVTLAGHNLASWPQALRYRLIGYLAQETHLLDDTVATNLRLGHPELPDAALWQALETLGLASALRQQGDGLHYEVGESGHRLSGGQGRRLALASLVLRDTPVALLDEPFSALDRETEQHVLADLSPWIQRRRVVIVTHAPERLPPTWPRLGLSSPP
ncbi:MAG: thiol reductant ABC exporter subunit CydC [Gammaproteobacteria bacterium]